MDWSILDIARLANTTSRTLRHYGDLGLLQRILMLRELGLGLPAIGEVLGHQKDEGHALQRVSWRDCRSRGRMGWPSPQGPLRRTARHPSPRV